LAKTKRISLMNKVEWSFLSTVIAGEDDVGVVKHTHRLKPVEHCEEIIKQTEDKHTDTIQTEQIICICMI
jgi:hypothetical protein